MGRCVSWALVWVDADLTVRACPAPLGGALNSDELFSSVELMLQLNLFSALMSACIHRGFDWSLFSRQCGGVPAARVATNTLAPNGLVALTGSAVAAEEGTPGMIAYGISKAATHQIVRSLAYVDAPTTRAGSIGNATTACLRPHTRLGCCAGLRMRCREAAPLWECCQ